MAASSREQTPAAVGPVQEDDGPLTVLVQTKTHLVPGDKDTEHGVRTDATEKMICQHVLQRDLDRLRERAWHHKCHFVVDDRGTLAICKGESRGGGVGQGACSARDLGET